MKQLIALLIIVLSAFMSKAQDVITLKTGETINAQVAEVGITEIKYYKADNPQGPLYVASKSEVMQIVYKNGSKDVFTSSVNSGAAAQQQKTVIVERPVRRRNYRGGGWLYPLVTTHIDLGHHGGWHYGGHYGGGHHGGHH